MSKHDKTLAKINSRPVPSGIKWSQLRGLLKYLGYKCIAGSGSRRKFYHKDKDALIICHEPHPENTVDKGCVADVAQHLKEHGFIK